MKRLLPLLLLPLLIAAVSSSTFTGPVPPLHAQPVFSTNLEWPRTDFSKRSVELSEIQSGGPSRDGIPSIDAPKFVAVSQEKDLAAREPVISLAIGGDARAYPLRILMWHEIVNDNVGGVPVIVTYCPLCNSALVFRRTVEERVLDFGTTGRLRNSDLVMYDRQSESWWQQFTGTAIVGEMTGTELESVPARIESFERFLERHPEGKVLVPTDPASRAYGRNPYGGYDSLSRPFLFSGEMPEGIEPMARVVAFESEGAPIAMALTRLREKGRIEIGDIVLSWETGQSSALDTAEIAKGRDIGNVVARRQSENGLVDIVYDVTFAFAFNAFHPEAKILTE